MSGVKSHCGYKLVYFFQSRCITGAPGSPWTGKARAHLFAYRAYGLVCNALNPASLTGCTALVSCRRPDFLFALGEKPLCEDLVPKENVSRANEKINPSQWLDHPLTLQVNCIMVTTSCHQWFKLVKRRLNYQCMCTHLHWVNSDRLQLSAYLSPPSGCVTCYTTCKIRWSSLRCVSHQQQMVQ